MATAHEFFAKTNGQTAKVGDRPYEYDLTANTWTESPPFTGTLLSVSPTVFSSGGSVIITGTGLTGATAVSFNGSPVSSFVVNSDTQITFSVAASQSSESLVLVTTAGGNFLLYDVLLSYTSSNGDPDAAVVIAEVAARGGTLTTDIEQAINNRIIAFKAAGLWSSLEAYYGFVGGTGPAHSINWKNPGTYDVSWVGSFIHDADGTHPATNATSNYGELTGFSPSIMPQTASCFGYVVEQDKIAGTGNRYIAGAEQGSNRLNLYRNASVPSSGIGFINASTSAFVDVGTADFYLSAIRTSISGPNSLYVSINNSSYSYATSASSTPNIRTMHILGKNDDNSNDSSTTDIVGSVGFIGSSMSSYQDSANSYAEAEYQAAVRPGLSITQVTAPADPDPDVKAIFDAVALTGYQLTASEGTAISARVASFKSDGIWADLIAYYGFIGDIRGCHSINWKSPGTYDIVWLGDVDTTTAGVKLASKLSSNLGVIVGLSPSLLPKDDVSAFYYLTDVSAATTSNYVFGSETVNRDFFVRRDSPNTMLIGANQDGSSTQSVAGVGYGSLIRPDSANVTVFNAGLRETLTKSSEPFVGTAEFHVLGKNDDGINDSSSDDAIGCLGFIARALTAAEDDANSASESAYQSAMGR